MADATTFSDLRLPMQAAPVDRMPAAAALNGSGMEASGWFDDIVGGIGAVSQAAGPILGALGV
jgi:hypothetical protein